MSTTHDIDIDETFFQFDPFESLAIPSSSQPLGTEKTAGVSALGQLPVSEDMHFIGGSPARKGKVKTMPLPIRPSTIVRDLFEFSPPGSSSYASSLSSMAFSPSTSNFSSDLDNPYCRDSFLTEGMEPSDSPNSEVSFPNSYTRKGKEKASFPMLPPLSFSAIELDYDRDVPPTPGPSSYGTLYSPPLLNQGLPPSSAIPVTDISIPSPSSFQSQEDSSAVSKAPVKRCRSLINLSHQSSPPSLESAITPQSSPSSSNIARQLLDAIDKKETDSVANLSMVDTTLLISTLDLQAISTEPSSCPSAWYTASKVSARAPASREVFKSKSRSRSTLYPISALDIVPVVSTDIFQPLPVVIFNYFELFLPKELRLYILCALVDLHENDYQRFIHEGRLTMAKATSSRGRWVGRDKGIRELFKFSRVSKSWQALIFDGQLWDVLDLHSFPGLPQEVITRIVRSAGSFIQSMNLSGHVNLVPETLAGVNNELCLKNPDSLISHNQLTFINLQGCTSLTSRSLHQLLVRSRSLTTLCVKGLSAVTNTTCDIISNFCHNLISLNMSRCANMDAEGIKSLSSSANLRRVHLQLKELRLSGLKSVTDATMGELGRAAPFLEILDLGYSRQLHNSALEAFVACGESSDANRNPGSDTVVITARDLGREMNDASGKFLRRRITRLRHLVLSYCTMLTDTACSNLAYSVPKLELLELAGIGPEMRDDGLIRMLQQTPHIRRVDLEDASDLTDAVIRAITPAPEMELNIAGMATTSRPKQPGHALQQLNISYAANLSDGVLLSLIRNCQYLTVLEADNARMGKNVLREFVKLSRERKALDARIVAVDCRGINESLVKDLVPTTRPRLGFRRYDARKLNYLDARDDNEDEMKVGQDECDRERVVVKTFYSWQTVDAVKAVRDKRRKAAGRNVGSESTNGAGSDGEGGVGRNKRRSGSMRWWSPGGRRSRGSVQNSGSASPIFPELNSADGCVAM